MSTGRSASESGPNPKIRASRMEIERRIWKSWYMKGLLQRFGMFTGIQVSSMHLDFPIPVKGFDAVSSEKLCLE